VGDHDYGGPEVVARLLEQLDDPAHIGPVELAGRLVGQQ